MAKHRVIFNEGASKNGLTEKQSTVLFDDMEKFAGYSFNKSHSAATPCSPTRRRTSSATTPRRSWPPT